MKQTVVAVAVMCLLSACTAPEQTATTDMDTAAVSKAAESGPLEGAWQIQQFTYIDASGNRSAVQNAEGLYIFAGKYYSIVLTLRSQPRQLFTDPFNPTEKEKIEIFDILTVNTGTYETTGSKLTTHPMVAKWPGFAEGRWEGEFRIEGDTLFITDTAPRSYLADGRPFPDTGSTEAVLVRLR